MIPNRVLGVIIFALQYKRATVKIRFLTVKIFGLRYETPPKLLRLSTLHASYESTTPLIHTFVTSFIKLTDGGVLFWPPTKFPPDLSPPLTRNPLLSLRGETQIFDFSALGIL